MSDSFPGLQRPRRNRISAGWRSLVQENQLTPSDLVWPLFVCPGEGVRDAVPSMPSVFRCSIDQILAQAEQALSVGIHAIALFPVIPDEQKDAQASASKDDEGLLQRCLRALRQQFPQLMVISDVAMDPYSSDGHDGRLIAGRIDNDSTLPILAAMAISQARAGAGMVAPSDMMDGRVGYIRQALDEAGFHEVGIISYCAKYASNFYGPFRDALDSRPRQGDKKTYQMNPGNAREALREAALDEREGADVLLVKPGLPYLDIIQQLRQVSHLPIAAYQVSGEYAMLQAAARKGWLDYESCLLESLMACKRAGADMVFTYGAYDAARLLKASDR